MGYDRERYRVSMMSDMLSSTIVIGYRWRAVAAAERREMSRMISRVVVMNGRNARLVVTTGNGKQCARRDDSRLLSAMTSRTRCIISSGRSQRETHQMSADKQQQQQQQQQ